MNFEINFKKSQTAFLFSITLRRRTLPKRPKKFQVSLLCQHLENTAGNTLGTGKGPSQHTKNHLMIFSEQITVFEYSKYTKTGAFLISAYSIVESDRTHSGLLRNIFKSFGNKKLTRLHSDHM